LAEPLSTVLSGMAASGFATGAASGVTTGAGAALGAGAGAAFSTGADGEAGLGEGESCAKAGMAISATSDAAVQIFFMFAASSFRIFEISPWPVHLLAAAAARLGK
jgi:hypothetical protein